MRNIVLVGFMGTGKSVVGRALAKKLKMKYVSTDDIIKNREGRAINDIFAKEGESYFRRIEKDVVKEASGMKDTVIAAGGGVVLDDENIKNLRKNGILILLKATPEEILERTGKLFNRPLLNVPSPLDEIKKLLEKRNPFYAKADYTVDTTGKRIDDLISEIIEILQGRL